MFKRMLIIFIFSFIVAICTERSQIFQKAKIGSAIWCFIDLVQTFGSYSEKHPENANGFLGAIAPSMILGFSLDIAIVYAACGFAYWCKRRSEQKGLFPGR